MNWVLNTIGDVLDSGYYDRRLQWRNEAPRETWKHRGKEKSGLLAGGALVE